MSNQKRTYQPPTLREEGSVADLTLAAGLNAPADGSFLINGIVVPNPPGVNETGTGLGAS